MLKENVYKLIDTQRLRLLLALKLNVSEMTIRNYINNRSEQLTLASVLEVIKIETGLTDAEILESEITA